jgi:hypothetical protein
MYCIIKKVKKHSRIAIQYLPVILLDSNNEVWEFDTLEEAENMKEIFQTNSDSGHIYEVKKI